MKIQLPPSNDHDLRAENAELRARLEEAEETLRAIRAGEVDALVVEGDAGPQIFTLQGFDAEQNRFRGEMLEQVSDAVVGMDTEDRITFLNAAAERRYGVRANDVLGGELTEIYTRLWPNPEAEAAMRTALSERGEWRGELIHRTLDGRELHVETDFGALRGRDGERKGMVAAIRDVTARKHLEMEKAEALRLLDTLLTSAPVGFLFLDRDLRFVRINERLAEMNGLSIKAHLGRTVAEILPTLEPTLREVTARILATGQPVLDHEFSGGTVSAPGVTRYWCESWYPVRDEHGEIIGFGAVVEDITERRAAEAALRNSEQRFRGIFDSALQFIGLMTPDGTLIEANRTALEAGGLQAENVIGKPFWECDWWKLTERTGWELRTAIGRAASGELVRYDVDVRGAEGQVVTIDFSIKPIRDEAGRVVLLIPEGRDITCLKRAEENLRLTNQRFALAVKCSQAVLWQQDLELRYTWLHNQAPGINGSDAVGKRDEDLWERAGDAAVIVALKREVIRSGAGLRQEFSPHVQGVSHCFEVLMEPLRDAAGRITGITGAALDITQLKRAEEARREMEQNYRALAVASSEITYRMSADWSTMLPFDGRQLVPSSDRPLTDWAWLDQNLPGDEHPRVRQAISEAIARKALFELEHRVRRPDGSIGWTFSRAVPLLDENKEVIAWFGAASDITSRKQAEQALADRTELLNGVLEGTTDVIFVKDLDGRLMLANAACAAVFNAPPEQVVGKMAEEFFPPDVAAAIRQHDETVIAGESPIQVEESFLVAGKARVFLTLKAPLRDGSSRVIGVLGIGRDITTRKRMEESLRESETRIQQALRVSQSFTFDWSPETDLVRRSASAGAILHLAGKEAVSDKGLEYFQRIHPEDRGRFVALMTGLRPEARDYAVEYRVVCAEGVMVSLEEVGKGSFDAAGKLVGIEGVTTDVTRRLQAEAELRDNQERMNLATETTGVGIWEWNTLTGTIRWDTQMFRLYGVVPTDDGRVSYETWSQAVLPEDRPYQEEVIQDTLRRQGQGSREFRIRRADNGEIRIIKAVETARANDEGTTEWFVGTNLDVTERRQAAQKLSEAKEAAETANRSKDRFLAILSHELRTPLTPVLMAVAALEHDPSLRPDVRSEMTMIRRNIEMETKLIDDLLDVSRIASGKLELRIEPLDLNGAVEQVCSICRSQVLAQEIQLTFGLCRDTGFIHVDPARFEQVLWNVLKNAVKFAPRKGKIHISTKRLSPDRVEVRITDNGVGIPPEVLPRIFEAFEQGHPSVTRQFGGLGLGLAISKSLVELHGGTLRAESPGTGHGATFIIEVPGTSQLANAPTDHAAPTLAQTTSLRLLIVEDHVDTLQGLKTLLTLEGFTVTTAGDVASALELARTETFDILLSDLGLPDASGHELMTQMQEIQPLRGIAMSGFGMEEDVRRSLAAGFSEHFVKPIKISQLLAAIQRLLAAGDHT